MKNEIYIMMVNEFLEGLSKEKLKKQDWRAT
jgi:hypothetical protein